MERRFGEILFLVIILAVLAGGMYALVPAGLYSNEEGVQYVQMRNFALNGSREIAWPGFGLGLEAKDLAGPGGLFEARDGRLYAITPPFFPWVASLFYPIVGERAVDFVPILFVFLSALVLGLILDGLMKRDFLYWLLLAAFLFGSPVFMQGFQFSGMALALLLIVSALRLLAGHFWGNPSIAKLFGASFLMGVSVLVKPECAFIAFSFYLCATLVLVSQTRTKEMWMVLAGCVFCLTVLILHDVILHGRFPGSYLEMFLPFYALSPIRLAALGGGLAVSCALSILSRREGISPIRKAVLSILPVILALGAVLLTAARITVSPLMALFPAVLFLLYGFPERLERLKKGEGIFEAILATATVVSLVLGAAILRPGTWIVLSVWLPAVPFVILLIALERKVIFAALGMYIVLAFFCGVAFVNGIQESREQILKYRDYNASRIAFLEKNTSAGDLVLFDDAGSMEHAGPLFFDRIFLMEDSAGDQERLARIAVEREIERAYVWTRDPRAVSGYNPYNEEPPPAFPPPPGSKPCCKGSCKDRTYYLVRLAVRETSFAAAGRGGSLH